MSIIRTMKGQQYQVTVVHPFGWTIWPVVANDTAAAMEKAQQQYNATLTPLQHRRKAIGAYISDKGVDTQTKG